MAVRWGDEEMERRGMRAHASCLGGQSRRMMVVSALGDYLPTNPGEADTQGSQRVTEAGRQAGPTSDHCPNSPETKARRVRKLCAYL